MRVSGVAAATATIHVSEHKAFSLRARRDCAKVKRVFAEELVDLSIRPPRADAQPLAANDTADGRALNRRVEIKVPLATAQALQ